MQLQLQRLAAAGLLQQRGGHAAHRVKQRPHAAHHEQVLCIVQALHKVLQLLQRLSF